MIGATVRMGAGVRTLSMQGHTWDLLGLSRHETQAVGGLISDTMGLRREGKPFRSRGRHHQAHKSK